MKKRNYRRRQIMVLLVAVLTSAIIWVTQEQTQTQPTVLSAQLEQQYFGDKTALETLEALAVKGRAPKTGYARAEFGNGWGRQGACDVRNIVLSRDLTETTVDEQCRVQKGLLNDPYTGAIIAFERGTNSSAVQIDHVVALSDAWQKGAQALDRAQRESFANDPLNLLAVDGPANQQKGDGDAATWLPSNKAFRCQYVARQVAVKHKYDLWVTSAEKDAIARILGQCEPA